MTALFRATQLCVMVFLLALAAIVGVGLLNGRISTRGLLNTKSPSGAATLSPARIQLLLATVAAAAMFLSRALEQRSSGRLPDVPNTWLAMLGTSHLLYLGTKAAAFLLPSVPVPADHAEQSETPPVRRLI